MNHVHLWQALSVVLTVVLTTAAGYYRRRFYYYRHLYRRGQRQLAALQKTVFELTP